MVRAITAAATLIGATLLVAMPWLLDAYWLRIATGVLMWMGLAASWNIVGGYAGYISFGHSAFFGIGAYATAILMGSGFGLPFLATIPIGLIAAAAVAGVIGAPTMRLRGSYFAIATWAFAEMLYQLVTVLEITGGTGGLSLPPFLNEHFFYFVMLATAAATYALVWLLFEYSRFGFRIKALRDHEPAAEAMGINTVLVKVQAFALSAAIAAVFGSIYAYWVTFIDPPSALGGQITDQMVVMVLLGGLGTVWGPALGGALLWLLNRTLWASLGDTTIYIPILGVLIALVVLFLPNGLVSLIPRRRAARSDYGLLKTLVRKL